MKFAVKFWREGVVVVAAVLASLYFPALLTGPLIDLGWRSPVQNWMMSVGLGALAGHFGLLYAFIPDIFLNLLAGLCIGLFGGVRRLRLSVLFGVAYFAAPLYDRLWVGSFFGWYVTLIVELWCLAWVPLPPAVAWFVSRRSRRLEYRIAHGLCLACGYNLTGNVSGICPECGTPIPDDLRR